MNASIDTSLIVSFTALICGLAAYFAGFALLQATRRRPPTGEDRAGRDANIQYTPYRIIDDPPTSRRLLESTPY